MSSVLGEHGFAEMSVPKLEGSVDSAISALESSVKSLEGEKAPLQKKLVDLKKQHEDMILAADEYLSMQTQKTEAPLRFAATSNAFVVDGWVPTEQFNRLKGELETAAGGRIDVQMLDDKESDELVEHGEDIPTQMNNPGIAKPFELITRLFAIPEYKEFDPTVLIFAFFPVMFGMILGDVGYGIMILLVLFLLERRFRTEGWRQLINIVKISSVWAIVFGFVFGEIFGPLGLWGKVMGHLSEEEDSTPEVD